MQRQVTISNERQQCEWNKETYIGETHVFFPLHKFERYSWQCNNKNKTSTKKGNERYQYRSYTKPNMKARGNWKVTYICKENSEHNDNNETRKLGVMQTYVRTYILEQYTIADQFIPI